jgi:Fe-S oxidoreductase
LHTNQVEDRLLKDGTLKPVRRAPLTVNYHDPCHLGRQGEDYEAWDGKEVKIYGQAVVYDPPRPRYNGAYGVYDAPRDVLKAIPGVELIEMERSREAAWCCGAGGNVREAYPEFNAWTAAERVKEAKSTGAEALVSACSGCEKNFAEAVAAAAATGSPGADLKILDVLELLEQSL